MQIPEAAEATLQLLQIKDIAPGAFILIIAYALLAGAGFGFVWFVRALLDVILTAAERGGRIWLDLLVKWREHRAKLRELDDLAGRRAEWTGKVPGAPP